LPLAEEWLDLAARSFAAAEVARELVPEDQADGDRAELLALLHAAVGWLGSCGPVVAAQPRRGGPLPAWLRKWIGSTEDDSEPAANASMEVVVAAARQAAQRLGAPGNGGAETDLDLESLFERATLQAKSWLADPGPIAQGLPVLAGKLRRLASLECDFQHQLRDEKLLSLKQLAYGASHEINNPLANISTRAQTLLRNEDDPERRQMLATINRQAFRAHDMISDLMLFARPPSIEPQPIAVAAVIDSAVAEVAAEAQEQATEIVVKTAADCPNVLADENQLVIALKALLANSLEAIGNGGRIEIVAGPVVLDELDPSPPAPHGQRVELRIRDTGPGVTADQARHLFDPFYSGREAGRGLGFGLTKCWRIVKEHGGDVVLASQPGRGAEFAISLPVAGDKPDGAAFARRVTGWPYVNDRQRPQ